MALLVVALVLLSQAQSAAFFLGAALVFGFATGLNSPTLYAWTIDLSDPIRRGRAVATMYMALEAGIGSGALASGWIFSNLPARLPYVHLLSATVTLMALGYLVWGGASAAGGGVSFHLFDFSQRFAEVNAEVRSGRPPRTSAFTSANLCEKCT